MIYRKCAEEFGFKKIEVDGKVCSTASELYQIFGYSQARNVTKVLSKHGVGTRILSGLRQNDASHARQELGLPDTDFSTRLIDYSGFLTIALEGKSSACDKVREYLRKMEMKARVDSVVYETTGMDASDFQTVGKYSEDSYAEFRILEGMRKSNQKDEAKKRHSIALRDMFHPVGSESKDSRLKKFSFWNAVC